MAVAYIDVIGLKSINATLGLPAGDALLKHVVPHLKMHLPPAISSSRLGGDELHSLCPVFASMQAAELGAFGAG